MSLMNNQSSNNSSNCGEAVAHPVNVLASCYIVANAAQLKGLHYCTTAVTGLPSPPTSPPLAAITSSNELALVPKNKKRDMSGTRSRDRRGGAALVIREECERFFCESMKTVFRGEGNLSMHGSGLASAFELPTPPPESQLRCTRGHDDFPPKHPLSDCRQMDVHGFQVDAWMEIWDYVGGASFRAFLTSNGEDKSIFVFFNMDDLMGRDLKRALMALIELAEGPLDCFNIVTCIDRRLPVDEALELTRSLEWVGFEMTTLDYWANEVDVTSNRWVYMVMEL